MSKQPSIAFWFSTPNVCLLEMVAQSAIEHIVLDIEHGLFDLRDVDHFILTAKLFGMTVHAKTLVPEMGPIQQMLDFGADSVIIPHIENFEHAKDVCAYAKYPPLGKRSSAGGRTQKYEACQPGHYKHQNEIVKCYPMIETEDALRDVRRILSLDTVDGVFIGPTDLSLSRGRGRYKFADGDVKDIMDIIAAANSCGKRWIMPAWREGEQKLAMEKGAYIQVIEEEQGVMMNGLGSGPINFRDSLFV